MTDGIKQINIFYHGMTLRRDYVDQPLAGILEALNGIHGHLLMNDIISISGNKNHNSNYQSLIEFVLPYGNYYSRNEENSHICFDFKENYVSLSAYTIKSTDHHYFLKSWVIEGSNDQSNWIELDSHKNDNTLCTPSAIHTFQIPTDKKIKKLFKYIRIRITGPNSKKNYILEITNIEFFGKLYKDNVNN